MTPFRFPKVQSQQGYVAISAFTLLAFCCLFGGASQQHLLRLAVVELVALVALAIAVPAALGTSIWRDHRFLLTVLALLCLLPLVQLIPLPPGIWTRLPGREQAVLATQLTGVGQGWTPLSLTPDLTWGMALALLPPVAMLVCTLVLGARVAGRLAWGWPVAAAASIGLGILQKGSGSPRLYPWPTTDVGAMVGLMANNNHLSALCLACIPICAVLAARTGFKTGREPRFAVIPAGLALAILPLSILVIGSRAGVVLLLVVLPLSAIAAWMASGRPRPDLRLLGAGIAACIAAVVGLAWLFRPAVEGLSVGNEGRLGGWAITADTAQDYLPVGSGLGSFDAVYRSVEPVERLTPLFFNHAHNEYLEIWMETGWPGVALVIAFLIWFARRSWTVWMQTASSAMDLPRAASIVILTLVLHSGVDYPLRTATLAVLFAFCCGILELGVVAPDTQKAKRRRKKVRVRRRDPAPEESLELAV